ncbi:MAG: TonB-dependent receptor [Cytophagaceae bacterium]|nr:TonB-dependent receptor [Cytophagaceae bacterium]
MASTSAFAQDEENLGTEVVNVVKPYTPEIGEAFKVKSTPQLNDSVNMVKKKVTYGIFSVPVASTFTPEKGQAAEVEKAKPVKLYDNYTTLGFGTYGSVLAEFYSNFEVDRNKNFGIYLNHNSSQGNIDGVELDSKFYDTDLNMNYSSYDRDLNWRTDLDLEHGFYNWYGIDTATLMDEAVIKNIEPGHNFFGGAISGNLDINEGFFEGGKAKLQYFGDSFSSSEIRAVVMPRINFPITDEHLFLDLKLDYVNGKFDRNYVNSQEINYSQLNVSASPSLQILRDDLTLNLGVSAALNMDGERSETNIFLYPRVTASYRVVDEFFIAYAGIEGELQQNTYRDFAKENPFISPTIDSIRPTDQQYDSYIGIKGKLSSNLSYNLRGSYIAQNDKALFKYNPRYDDGAGSTGNEGYQFGNSFNVVFDDVETFSFFGELNYDLSNLKLRINAEAFTYDTTYEEEAWNLPDFKASFYADYQIDEHWFTGAQLFYVGERKDEFNITGPAITENPYTVTLGSYFDANLHLGYRFNDQLSIFARGNNLLNNNYQRWMNFPVQGIQAIAGATYKFDW